MHLQSSFPPLASGIKIPFCTHFVIMGTVMPDGIGKPKIIQDTQDSQ